MTSTVTNVATDASSLTPEQRDRVIEVMQEYLSAPPNRDGKTPVDLNAELDANRVSLIDGELQSLLASYLSGIIPVSAFKSQVDGINKRNAYWGFKGIKGQMFFNMLVNVAEDFDGCDAELKAAIRQPEGDDVARSRITTFISFVRRIGEQHVEAGGTKHGRPKPSSIPFFLSYFWQIQDREHWPIYYTASVHTLADLNVWQARGDGAADYLSFKRLYDELMPLLTEASGQAFNLYQIEHLFWFKGGNPYGGTKGTTGGTGIVEERTELEPGIKLDRLPESYVPPVVAIISRMASNEADLVTAAKASGVALDRAFEKHINATFTILGYDAQLLGQGQGRVPDGLAIDVDNSYAVIWDAKVRADGYSMGTDDRTIREYIMTQSRKLKKRGSLRNVYYVIVSSGFADDYDDTIRSLKMDTDVSEVCLVEADALVAMVDAKLRDPHTISLGPDGIQRLFSTSGVLTANSVLTALA